MIEILKNVKNETKVRYPSIETKNLATRHK